MGTVERGKGSIISTRTTGPREKRGYENEKDGNAVWFAGFAPF